MILYKYVYAGLRVWAVQYPYPCPYPFKFVGITRIRAQTHKSGVLPYPLWVFFAGIHWAWVQLPSLHACFKSGHIS